VGPILLRSKGGADPSSDQTRSLLRTQADSPLATEVIGVTGKPEMNAPLRERNSSLWLENL
jgi:hypothetical protein